MKHINIVIAILCFGNMVSTILRGNWIAVSVYGFLVILNVTIAIILDKGVIYK